MKENSLKECKANVKKWLTKSSMGNCTVSSGSCECQNVDSQENRKQSTNAEMNDTPEATRHRTGPTLWQPIFNWSANNGYIELTNFK